MTKAESLVKLKFRFGFSSKRMEKFHQDSCGTETRHTMVVGHVGAGKSVTAKKYATAVIKGEIETMRGIEMVW